MAPSTLSASLLLLAFGAASAEIVEFLSCPDYKVNGLAVERNCSVHDVIIHPCIEAKSQQPCKIRKGQSAGISFSFTPAEAADEVESLAYWHGTVGDVPLHGMDSDACHFTGCPVVPGETRNYKYDLQMSRKFPSREYGVMWKLWNKGKDVKFECCFIVRIRILGAAKNQ